MAHRTQCLYWPNPVCSKDSTGFFAMKHRIPIVALLATLVLLFATLTCSAAHADRIGIIGAGSAGLTSAWLLEEGHDVTVLEKSDRLGGHADTLTLNIAGHETRIEGAAEFVSGRNYPRFMALLRALGVETHSFPMTYSFMNTASGAEYLLPPFYEGGAARPDLYTDFDYLTVNLQFLLFLQSAQALVAAPRDNRTLGQFLDGLGVLGWFKRDFLLPFLGSFWGISLEEARRFEAYPSVQWLVNNSDGSGEPPVFEEVVGGLSYYIAVLASQLRRTRIYPSTEAVAVTRVGDEYWVTTAPGHRFVFDQLIFAANAQDSARLMTGIATAQRQRNLLRAVEYFKTTIAIHGDDSFMPHRRVNWGTVNVRYDGHRSAMTTYLPWHNTRARVYKSWVSYEADHGLPMPSPLYARREYWHPKLTAAYSAMQRGIAPLQGASGLWIAGMHTQGMDNHESAVVSAIAIARRLLPHSRRLAEITR